MSSLSSILTFFAVASQVSFAASMKSPAFSSYESSSNTAGTAACGLAPAALCTASEGAAVLFGFAVSVPPHAPVTNTANVAPSTVSRHSPIG